jgi:hypothetical protein
VHLEHFYCTVTITFTDRCGNLHLGCAVKMRLQLPVSQILDTDSAF